MEKISDPLAGQPLHIKELKPASIFDVMAMVALYRPGPMGSGMLEDFIRRIGHVVFKRFLFRLFDQLKADKLVNKLVNSSKRDRGLFAEFFSSVRLELKGL